MVRLGMVPAVCEKPLSYQLQAKAVNKKILITYDNKTKLLDMHYLIAKLVVFQIFCSSKCW